MTKFTPGPWVREATYDHNEHGFAVYASKEPGRVSNPTRGIVAVTTSPELGDEITAAANGTLVAAAPDLYEACQMAFEDLEQYEWTDLPGGYAVKATVDALRAALTKADGQEER